MKILHLSSEASWRGGEQQIMYLVEESRKFGVDAQVVCRVDSQVHDYCKNSNIPHFAVPFKSAYDIGSALQIRRIAKKGRFDIVQTHTSKSHTVAVLAGLLGMNTPQILTRRVDFPVKKNWFSRFKYNYSKIVRIICISDTILEMTAPDIQDQSKLVSIHSGIDVGRFDAFQESDWLRETYDKPATVHIIGNTSAISDQKDYYTFVRVVERLIKIRQDVHFFIVGDGPDRKEIEEYVRERRLTEWITFTGFQKNIRAILPSFDVFLFTSKTEGLGTSVLDAMAAGVPIVTTSAGGIPEMISHDQNGLMYPVKDDAGLAEGVLAMLNDPKRAQELAASSKEKVKDFSKEKTAQRTIEVYKEILRNKKGH